MNRLGLYLVLTVALLGGAARQGASQIAPARGDSVAPRVRADGAQLSPVILTYIATLQQGLDTRSLGERAVRLTKTIYAGLSAWEIVETHGAGSNASVDTLIADFQTLYPLHWGATQQMPTSQTSSVAARVAVEFRADSMIGIMMAPSGRRTIVAPMPGGAYLTAAHLETAMRVLPVTLGWRDSVSIVVTDLGRTTVVPGEVAVTGEEKLQTTAGSFDCWIVNLVTEVGRTDYWVSKADRIVVKTSQVLPESGDVLVYLLTGISH